MSDTWEYKEVAALALKEGMAELEALADIIAPNGVPYDAEEIHSHAEFAAFVVGLRQPTPEHPNFTVWEFLEENAPGIAADLAARFERTAPQKMIGA